jgi:hypothetical protein
LEVGFLVARKEFDPADIFEPYDLSSAVGSNNDFPVLVEPVRKVVEYDPAGRNRIDDAARFDRFHYVTLGQVIEKQAVYLQPHEDRLGAMQWISNLESNLSLGDVSVLHPPSRADCHH